MNNIERIWYLYPRYVEVCKNIKNFLTPKEFGQKHINSNKRNKRKKRR